MRALYLLALLCLVFLAELLAGNCDLPFFLAALVVYYASLVTSPGIGVSVSIGFGILLDLTYGRNLPVTAVILTSALLSGKLIRFKAPTHPLETALPGMGVSLISVLGGGIARFTLSTQPEPIDAFLWKLIFFGTLGFFLMPLLTRLFDALGSRLGLESAIREPKACFGRLRPRRVREVRGRCEIRGKNR